MYVLIFFSRNRFLMANPKEFVPFFYNHNTNLYDKFEF